MNPIKLVLALFVFAVVVNAQEKGASRACYNNDCKDQTDALKGCLQDKGWSFKVQEVLRKTKNAYSKCKPTSDGKDSLLECIYEFNQNRLTSGNFKYDLNNECGDEYTAFSSCLVDCLDASL